MREVRYILCCCAVFAATILSGLAIHSCRTVKKTVHSDLSAVSIEKQKEDSCHFAALIEKWSRNWNLEIKYYDPVVDSSGLVVGQTLKKEVRAKAQEQQTAKKEEVAQTRVQNTDSIFVDKHQDGVTKRSPPGLNLRFFLYTVTFLVIIYFFVHKKKQ